MYYHINQYDFMVSRSTIAEGIFAAIRTFTLYLYRADVSHRRQGASAESQK